MSVISKHKLLVCSLLFLCLGFVFGALENHYYQYVDEQGYLHESLFLPLSVFSLLLGATGLLFVMFKCLWLYMINRLKQ